MQGFTFQFSPNYVAIQNTLLLQESATQNTSQLNTEMTMSKASFQIYYGRIEAEHL